MKKINMKKVEFDKLFKNKQVLSKLQKISDKLDMIEKSY